MSVAFDTTIRRVSSRAMTSVMTWGMLTLVPMGAGVVALSQVTSQSVVRTVVAIVGSVFALVYIGALGKVMAPAESPIRVSADPRGLEASGGWLARAEDLLAAQVCRPSAGATVRGVHVPAWPWTVYFLTRVDQFWLVVADQDEGTRMLSALGLPLDVRDLAQITQRPAERGRGWRIGLIVVIVNLALIAIGLLALLLAR